jgi:hypothetical protein
MSEIIVAKNIRKAQREKKLLKLFCVVKTKEVKEVKNKEIETKTTSQIILPIISPTFLPQIVSQKVVSVKVEKEVSKKKEEKKIIIVEPICDENLDDINNDIEKELEIFEFKSDVSTTTIKDNNNIYYHFNNWLSLSKENNEKTIGLLSDTILPGCGEYLLNIDVFIFSLSSDELEDSNSKVLKLIDSRRNINLLVSCHQQIDGGVEKGRTTLLCRRIIDNIIFDDDEKSLPPRKNIEVSFETDTAIITPKVTFIRNKVDDNYLGAALNIHVVKNF